MKSIFSRIFVGYLSIIILLASAVIYFSFKTINENYQENSTTNLSALNSSIQYHIKPLLLDSNYTELDREAKVMGKRIKARITVIDVDGNVLADSELNPKNMENHSDRPEFAQAIEQGKGTSIRYSHSTQKNMLYVALPLKINSKVVGVSRVSVFMDDYVRLLAGLKSKIINVLLITVFISLIIAYLFSLGMTRPLKKLVMISKAVGNGNYLLRTKFKRNDEIRALGDSFNDMIDKMELQLEHIEEQKDKVNNIISSLQQALVVLDAEGRVTLSNRSFQTLIENRDSYGKFYWEVLKEKKVHKLIKKIIETGERNAIEIQHLNDYYICEANRLDNNNEILVLFYDITDIKKLENVKKDFLVNVSHELRTPLTVIKGYLETIDENIDDNNKKYISIIQNHTNRLINIVNDLLAISSLEGKSVNLEVADINIKSLLESTKFSFEQKLKAKGLTLSINLDPTIETFKGDEFKMEQVFINLIDNAIKYTETGGIVVNVINQHSYIQFDFIDTGIGIPVEDLDRIFERLYTVDKSRSRQMAGTGLGLSIVKHIVMLHNGKISVESELSKGSRFTVLLPV
jgi:two-component system phosphate regulon sensor histidine kinase PhoR